VADRPAYRFFSVDRDPGELFVIAGPCVIESESMSLDVAGAMRDICKRLGVGYVFKSSYRKENRTSASSFTGGTMEEGLSILSRVRSEIGVPVLTDVHGEAETVPAAGAVDVLQIPAFLCRQTRLLMEAARASAVVNVKKGQFLAPEDGEHTIRKIHSVRPDCEVWLTERGTTFGYRDLVVDMRSMALLREMDCTVVFDVTHSLQHPGIGGDRRFARTLARAALAAGADGLFLETHPDPDRALSDAATQLPLDSMRDFVEEMAAWKRLQGEQARLGRYA
jgi:2-dehydro-3-deoxyphosphooctonate aldolase (KDO 8-P synthase)